MIEQLVHSLRALSSHREEQGGHGKADAERLDETARAFSDALLLVFDCPQIRLEPGQRAALLRLEEHLEGDRGGTSTSELATAALRALGYSVDGSRSGASC